MDSLEIPKSIHNLWKSNENTSFSYQTIKCFGIFINFHHSHILSKCILSRLSFWAAGFHFDVSSYLFFIPSVSDLCLDDFSSSWKRYWRIPLARFYVANCSFFFFWCKKCFLFTNTLKLLPGWVKNSVLLFSSFLNFEGIISHYLLPWWRCPFPWKCLLPWWYPFCCHYSRLTDFKIFLFAFHF